MPARLRLLKGATALLYIGPLIAGMSGFGWGLVPPFLGIFVLWLIILRPEQWPASATEWLTADALWASLAQVLSQLLLVVVLFGVGRGIGGIAGYLPMLHPLLPLSISFIAIPICRLIWDARIAAGRGEFLDDEAEAAQAPLAVAEAASAVTPLLALPDDATEDAARNAVASSMDSMAAVYRLEAVCDALLRSGRSHAALRRAVVIWATEPEVVAPGLVSNAVLTAYQCVGRNPDLLRLFLPRALALVAAFPDRVSGFPPAATLRAAAETDLDTGPNADLPSDLRADLRDGMLALAQAIEAASAPRSLTDVPRRDTPVHGSPSRA